MSKVQKKIITSIYGIGVVIVLILLGCILCQSHTILFPNVMLPMELHELASIWLSFGFMPMFIFTVLLDRAYHISQNYHIKVIFIYIPSIICFFNILFWIFVWLIGIIVNI